METKLNILSLLFHQRLEHRREYDEKSHSVDLSLIEVGGKNTESDKKFE